MKKLCTILICTLPLFACSKPEKKVDQNQTSSSQQQQSIETGKKLSIVNELRNKSLKLTAFDTNHSKGNKYIYQITIENLGEQPMNINSEQIVMVDSKGQEHKPGLIDRELTAPIEAKQQVVGVVGYDDVKFGEPKFIKIVENN